MAIRGGSSDKATPANEGAVGKGEGEPIVSSCCTSRAKLRECARNGLIAYSLAFPCPSLCLAMLIALKTYYT